MTHNFDNINKLYQYTVGFDKTYRALRDITETAIKATSNYPPYNIIETNDNAYVIELAIAGFTENDVEIELLEDKLIIRGKVDASDTSAQFLHQGIANRAFQRVFTVADTVEVRGADLLNGILRIYLENIVPKSKKSRKIEIGAPSASAKQTLME